MVAEGLECVCVCGRGGEWGREGKHNHGAVVCYDAHAVVHRTHAVQLSTVTKLSREPLLSTDQSTITPENAIIMPASRHVLWIVSKTFIVYTAEKVGPTLTQSMSFPPHSFHESGSANSQWPQTQ